MKLESDIQARGAEVEKLKETACELEALNARLQEDLKSSEDRATQMTTEKTSRLQLVEQDIVEKESEIQSLKQAQEALAKEMEDSTQELHATCDSQKNTIAELEKQLLDKECQVDVEREKTADLESHINSLTHQVDYRTSTVKHLEEEKSTLQQGNSRFLEQIQTLRKQQKATA